jgi:hypothetical protein
LRLLDQLQSMVAERREKANVHLSLGPATQHQ